MEGEIVARVERRRQWSAAEKAALLAEVEAEGGRVSVVAKRHRISESLLYNWRSAWKAAAEAVSGQSLAPVSSAFVQLGVIAPGVDDEVAEAKSAMAASASRGAGLTLAERIAARRSKRSFASAGCAAMSAAVVRAASR